MFRGNTVNKRKWAQEVGRDYLWISLKATLGTIAEACVIETNTNLQGLEKSKLRYSRHLLHAGQHVRTFSRFHSHNHQVLPRLSFLQVVPDPSHPQGKGLTTSSVEPSLANSPLRDLETGTCWNFLSP